MALELEHRCRLKKHNGCVVSGNVQIKWRNIIIRSPYNVTGGANLSSSFFHELAETALQKIYWVVLSCFLVGRCTTDPIIARKHRKSQIFMMCHLLTQRVITSNVDLI